MKQIELVTSTRTRVSKGDNRRLRAGGRVPAVLYGGGGEPRTIDVSAHEMEMILQGARRTNDVFNLELHGSGRETALARDIQRHPVSSRLIHVDFMRVDVNKEVEVEVVVHGIGTPAGVREGGVLEHVIRTLTVRCTPLNMPNSIDVDISSLTFNQSLHVSDVKVPEGVRVMNPPDTPLFAVLAPKAVEETTPAEGAAPAEPEVIGAKKKEAEEE